MRLYSNYSPEMGTHHDKDGTYCSVCGRQIYPSEQRYVYAGDTVCCDRTCMDTFYENNADEMLINFSAENNLEEEAKCWFYENI